MSSTKLSTMSTPELERELGSQREIVQALDLMILGQIVNYLKIRTSHVLVIFEIKRRLGIKKIRDKTVEDNKLQALGAEVKKREFPRPMLDSFYRSVFRYARWTQANQKKKQ